MNDPDSQENAAWQAPEEFWNQGIVDVLAVSHHGSAFPGWNHDIEPEHPGKETNQAVE